MKRNTNLLLLLITLISNIMIPIVAFAEIPQNDLFKFVENGENQIKLSVVDSTLDYDELEVSFSEGLSYSLEETFYTLKSDINKEENIYFEQTDEKINIEIGSEKLDILNLKVIGNFEGNPSITVSLKKENNVIGSQDYVIKSNLEQKVTELSSFAAEDVVGLQRDLNIEPLKDSILSGQDALYKVSLKTTGSQTKYNNAEILIKIPISDSIFFTQNLTELQIENVVPVYDEATGVLKYSFDKLDSGRTYEKTLKISTENGLISNNTPLVVTSELLLEEDSQTDSATVAIKSSKSSSISKKMVKITYNGQPDVAKPGGLITWELKMSIPYKDLGQQFLKEGSTIKVTDTLPTGLTFTKMEPTSDLSPTIVTPTQLVWNIKAPTIAEQSLIKEGSLFERKLTYTTQVKNDVSLVDKTLTNKVKLESVFVDNQTISSSVSSPVKIFASTGYNGEIEGSIVVLSHYGPLDTKGNSTLNDNKNPNPIGDDTAYLQFDHGMWAYRYAMKHDLKSLEYIYTIDPHLRLEKLYIPTDDTWYMATTNLEYSQAIKLRVTPKYDIKITYLENGVSTSKTITDPATARYYYLKDFGLNKGTVITEIRYIFKGEIPQGLANNGWFRYFFTVEPGYVGEVKNKLDMIGKSTYDVRNNRYSNGSVYYDFNLRKDNPVNYQPGTKDITGDRTAQIVATKQTTPPIAEVKINLNNHNSNVIQTGKNQMKIELINNSSSQSAISKPLEVVALLAPGVTIDEAGVASYIDGKNIPTSGKYEILSNNYNNSGRQLVKIIWNENYIRIGDKITATLDVNVGENAPSSLYFDVYGFSGDNQLTVPVSQNPQLTDTILQTDHEDINRNGNVGQHRIKSGNVYYLTDNYDLQTEKFVKGPGEEWSKLAKTYPEGPIDYRLFMTNSTGKDISNMTLIDVLPSIGDIGITDNVSRGSQFAPHLNGPIVLPTEWQDKVSVYYSTSKNPKRDDLTRYTDYPSGTLPLTNPPGAEDPNWMPAEDITDWSSISSFKIELLPGETWISGKDMNVLFAMTAPKVVEIQDVSILDSNKIPVERAAWNSFAVATDKGQPVEPLQVGVYMDDEIGRLELTKIDSFTKKALSNAKFVVSNTEGTFSQEVTTDENGKASIDKLPFGEYEVREVKAPEGYDLLQKPIKFTIKHGDGSQLDNYQIKLEIENTKQGWYLPNSGGLGTYLFYLVGAVLVALGIYAFLRKKSN